MGTCRPHHRPGRAFCRQLRTFARKRGPSGKCTSHGPAVPRPNPPPHLLLQRSVFSSGAMACAKRSVFSSGAMACAKRSAFSSGAMACAKRSVFSSGATGCAKRSVFSSGALGWGGNPRPVGSIAGTPVKFIRRTVLFRRVEVQQRHLITSVKGVNHGLVSRNHRSQAKRGFFNAE